MIHRGPICLLIFGCMVAGPSHSASVARIDETGESDIPDYGSLIYTEDDDNSLGPALNVLARRKREMTGKSNRPYSSSSTHRYRYPLYKKRSSYFPYMNYVDDPFVVELDGSYDVGLDDFKNPSFFIDDPRLDVPLLDHQDTFSLERNYKNDRTPSYREDPKQEAVLDLLNFPYDLQAMGRMYQFGKRAEENFNRRRPQATLDRSSPISLTPTSDMMKNAVANYKDRWNQIERLSLMNQNIRRKRSLQHPKDAANSTLLKPNLSLSQTPGNHNQHWNTRKFSPKPLIDRQKRGFTEYVPGDSGDFFDDDDLLAREYFKSLARATGAKKRMAYAQFQPDKRSIGIEALLENPSLLQYAQEQLKEAEAKVVEEAEEDLESHSNKERSENLLEKTVARLDALENIKDSLHQLEILQEDDVMRKRNVDLGVRLTEQDNPQRVRVIGKRRKNVAEVMENKAKKLKGQTNLGEPFFKGNRREECPILERLILNCVAVSKLVVDTGKIFVEPCLYHEICFMCGADRDVSRHECDAVLSSGLEAGCARTELEAVHGFGSPECHKAAGETFSILTDPSRYDDKGTCTHDPCIRQLLDSR